jgi:hypothetical protein
MVRGQMCWTMQHSAGCLACPQWSACVHVVLRIEERGYVEHHKQQHDTARSVLVLGAMRPLSSLALLQHRCPWVSEA